MQPARYGLHYLPASANDKKPSNRRLASSIHGGRADWEEGSVVTQNDCKVLVPDLILVLRLRLTTYQTGYGHGHWWLVNHIYLFREREKSKLLLSNIPKSSFSLNYVIWFILPFSIICPFCFSVQKVNSNLIFCMVVADHIICQKNILWILPLFLYNVVCKGLIYY